MSTSKKIGLLSSLIILVVVIWIISAVFILLFLDSWSDRGTFGDLFGAVNALFSGLAFAGVTYAIFLQKQDLELQKNEIALNREELKKSSKAQQKSEKALTAQVEQMKISAKLNALNTIISYYNQQLATPGLSGEQSQKIRDKRKATIKEIDLLIDRVGDDELD